MTPPKTKAVRDNGAQPVEIAQHFTLELDGMQMNLVYQFCVQGQFPTVELKNAAALLQQQIEGLVPSGA